MSGFDLRIFFWKGKKYASTIGRLWKRWRGARELDLNGEWNVTSGKENNGRDVI